MNADAAARLRSSYALIAPRAPYLIETFYRMLFASVPQLRALFPADMGRQQVHMIGAILMIVENAEHIQDLAGPLGQLGERHVAFGAQAEHYPVVRDTLVAALERVAGNAWTPQLTADWTQALNEVAALMIKGAEQVQYARREAA